MQLIGLTASNIMDIKYSLASDPEGGDKDLEIDDEGKYFIEAAENDTVTFKTEYPETNVENLYWGKGVALDVSENADTDYLYTASGEVTVTEGVADVEGLTIQRLPMLKVGVVNISKQNVVLKSVSINSVVVATPNVDMTPDVVEEPVKYDLRDILKNYMSYTGTPTLNYSVTVSSDGNEKTLTAECNTAEIQEVLIDASSLVEE